MRNEGPEGTKAKSRLTPRERFQLKRDSVYTKRRMRVYGLTWLPFPALLTGTQRFRLVFDDIEAVAVDYGLMSYCTVTVGGNSTRSRYKEEVLAGFGMVQIAALRGTQHVIELIEERVRLAERAMDGTA